MKSKLKWPSRCSFSAICVIFQLIRLCPALVSCVLLKEAKRLSIGWGQRTLYQLKLMVSMVASEKKEEAKVKVKDQVITAIYKLNLHCNECARTIEKPIIRTQGVQNVDIDVDSGRVTVKGIFDPNKMYDIIEKKSKRKVEWISPKPKEEIEEKIEKIQKKEEVIKSTIIKLHLHCAKCESDLENKLLKLRGVHSVKMNMGEQTCTIVGIIEEEDLIKYIYKKTGKRGEIIQQKHEKKSEVREIKEDEGDKKEEFFFRSRDLNMPYFIHCTHAPQWFSDEDPNSCTIM